MQVLSAIAVAVLALSSLAGVCAADPSPSATPTASGQSADTGLCLAYVERIDAASPPNTAYALTLAPVDGNAGIASGVIAAYAGNARYDIPFHDARVAPRAERNGYVPLIVRFPAGTHIDGAYVASLTGSEGGPCEPIIATASRDASYKAAGPASMVAAPQAVTLPAPTCAQPEVPAKTLHSEEPKVPATVPTRVAVDVLLSSTGAPLAAFVTQHGLNRALDATAMEAALNSTYSPQVFRCKRVGGRFLFTVDFGPEERD